MVEVYILTCSICGIDWSTQHDVEGCRRSHRHSRYSLECELCCKGFPSRSDLIVHVCRGACNVNAVRRNGGFEFGKDLMEVCSYCGYEWEKRSSAIFCRGSHPNLGNECIICDKTFPERDDLIKHECWSSPYKVDYLYELGRFRED